MGARRAEAYLKDPAFILIVQVTLCILLAVFQARKTAETPFWLFWLIFIPLIFISFFGILNLPGRMRIFSLLILDLSIYLITAAYNFNYYNMDFDSGYELGFARTIIEKRYLDQLGGIGLSEAYYGFNPAIHIVTASLSILSGLSVYAIGFFFLIYVIRVIFLLAAYGLLSQLFSKERDAAVSLAVFIFLVTPRAFVMVISRRVFAAMFILLALYFLLKARKSRVAADTRKVKFYTLLFFLSSLLIAISDHANAYLFVGFIISLFGFEFIVGLFQKRTGRHDQLYRKSMPFTYVLFFLIALLIWEMFIAYIFIIGDLYYFTSFYELIKKLLTLNFASVSRGTGAAFTVISSSEKYFVYLSQFAFLAFAAIGFLSFLKVLLTRTKGLHHPFSDIDQPDFALFLGGFGIAGYVVLSIIKLTPLGVMSNTYFWLFALGPSLFAALFIIDVIEKIRNENIALLIVAGVICLLYVGGLFATIHPSVFNRQYKSQRIVEYEEDRSTPLTVSGQWLSTKIPSDSFIIGDSSVMGVYGGFDNIKVLDPFWFREFLKYNVTYRNYIIFKQDYMAGINVFMLKKKTDIGYIILNKDLFQYPSFETGASTDPKEIPKIESINSIDKVYTNDQINIYRKRKFIPYQIYVPRDADGNLE